MTGMHDNVLELGHWITHEPGQSGQYVYENTREERSACLLQFPVLWIINAEKSHEDIISMTKC